MRSKLMIIVAVFALACGPAAAQTAESADTAYAAGNELLRARDHLGAAAAFERVVSAQPDHLQGWLKLGIARAGSRDWDGAIAAYDELIRRDPENAKALHNLGNVHYRRGDFEQATTAYAAALEHQPDYLLAAFHYGRMLRQLNRPEEAERVLLHCLELPADNDRDRRTHLDCNFYLGAVRYRAGDYESAAKRMEQLLGVIPDHTEARYYLGMSYRRLGRAEDARQQLQIHAELLERQRGPVVERDMDP